MRLKRHRADLITQDLFAEPPFALTEIATVFVEDLSQLTQDDELPEIDFEALLATACNDSSFKSEVQTPSHLCVDGDDKIDPLAGTDEVIGEFTIPVPATGPKNTRNFRFNSSHLPNGKGKAGLQARLDANIKALKIRSQLIAEKREATDDEKRVLSAYSGWGGMRGSFTAAARRTSGLQELLTEVEYEAAAAGTQTQHFTPSFAVQTIYAALQRMGIKPRRILDPAIGSGFFFGELPTAWRESATLYGVEIDPVLASIAQLLAPDAIIANTGFQKTTFPDNAFDLVVTNVPFADVYVTDLERPNERHKIHNFFITKALRKVRPGGVVAVITSSYTLDAKEGNVRELISHEADLIAAARLPTWSFDETASTAVSSDILILRKRMPEDMVPAAPQWLNSVYQADALVNQAMLSNTTWPLGGLVLEKNQYGMQWHAGANQSSLAGAIDAWNEQLPNGGCETPQESDQDGLAAIEKIEMSHLRRLRPGAYAMHNGLVCQVLHNGNVERIELGEGKESRIRSYIGIRDTLKRLLLEQIELKEDGPSAESRRELNQRYDLFVANFGPLGARYNRSLLRKDADYALTSAIEVFDADEQTAVKNAIMLRRTLTPQQQPTKANSVQDGYFMSLNVKGTVDVDYIAALTAKPVGRVITELCDAGMVYFDPQDERWSSSEAYLSGDIQAKLEFAQLAATENPALARNVEALKAAMPERIAFADISLQLGSTVIGVKYISDFIDHLMENDTGTAAATVTHMAAIARWVVKPSSAVFGNDKSKWGTSRFTARKLVEMALNLKNPTARDKSVNDEGREVWIVNPDDTLAAREKMMSIQEEFKLWIGTNEDRVKDIEEAYNRVFNTTRAFQSNGAHLTLPGLSSSISLRRHQKDGIWGNLCRANSLVGHCVGAGKTLVGICTAMELKRLGLRRCTMLTVPNHIVWQFAVDFLSAYPCANLLVIDPADAAVGQRDALLAKLATGEYDAVIVGHTTFGTFTVSEADLARAAEPMLRDLANASAVADDKGAVKELERSKAKLLSMLEKSVAKASGKSSITFDQLGCDQIIVDESQAFKNLWYVTSMERVAGLSSAFSQRAFDMFVKSRSLCARNGERGGLIFMSATPIANTVAEMFHLMRYMIMPTLIAKGIGQFDAWAANFGRTVVNVEVTPEGGGYRLQTRFAKFENLPELMALFGSFADIQGKEDLNLPTPAIAGGKPAVIAVPPSAALKDYIQSLVARAEAIRSTDKEIRPHPSVDNMLKVTTDGRMAALDMRLVGGRDEPGSKVNAAVANIHRIWEQTAQKRLTQLVFCDIGTPGNERCDIYQDIKDKLMAMGVPSNEIAFVHDFGTPAKLLIMQSRMNRGSLRVVIASTEKAGTGFNVQRLLVAEHELDCPWRSDQVDQRRGRIDRQGNLNDEIYMFRYVTEQSFDAYSWNLVEQKLRFILQVITSKCQLRSAEDIEVRALTVAEVKALATGNPKIIERAILQQTEAKLASLERTHYTELQKQRVHLGYAGYNIEMLQGAIERTQEDVITAAASNETAPITIMERTVTWEARDEIANLLAEAYGKVAPQAKARMREVSKDGQEVTFEIGAYRGLTLGISFLRTNAFEYEVSEQWILQGAVQWATEVGPDWRGNLTRIVNLAKQLPDQLSKRKDKLAEANKATASLKRNCEVPFGRASELRQTREKLREIEIELGIFEVDAQASGVETEEEECV